MSTTYKLDRLIPFLKFNMLKRLLEQIIYFNKIVIYDTNTLKWCV